MDRAKWLLIGFVVVYLMLEGLLFGYRKIRRQRQGRRPPASYVYDVKRYETPPTEETLYRELPRMALDFAAPRGLAAMPDDGIVVVGDRSVQVMTSTGELRRRVALDGEPTAVAVDAATNIYIGLDDHVAVLAPSATNTVAWTSVGENALLTSLSVGATNLFVADFGHRVVWRYDLAGRLLDKLGRRDLAKGVRGFILPSAYFDVVTDEDAVWAANTGRQSVEKHRLDGTVTVQWGQASMTIDGFCGCCNPSHLARTPDGRFVTSEKGLPRIKLYGPDGAYVGLVAGTDKFERDTEGLDLAVDAQGRILVLDPPSKAIRVFVSKEP